MAESERFSDCSEEEEIFRREGVEHWIEKIKEILKIPNLKLLRQLEKEDVDEVLSHVQSRCEKRALKRVLEQITCPKESVDVLTELTRAGLDDKVWVPKLEKQFNIDHIGLLKTVEKAQLHEFIRHVASSADVLALRQLFDKISLPEANKESTTDETQASGDWEVVDYPNTEFLRTVDGGVLCKGIYHTTNLEELVKERDLVIDISNNLEHKLVDPNREIFHHKFTSRKQMETFEKNIDKHIAPRSETVGENIWGVGLDQEKDENSFVSSLHFQQIPVACMTLKPQNMHLKPEVIEVLRNVERSLKQADSDPSNLFRDYFARFGTHVNNGDILLGGRLVTVAYSEGFLEKDRERVTNVVSEASEKALYLCLSDQVQIDVPINAYQVLGRTICSEDLQNITVIVKRVGGPKEAADHEAWEKQLLENSDTWAVIARQSIPLPLWKLLGREASEFDNFQRLSQAMLQAWKTESSEIGILENTESQVQETKSPTCQGDFDENADTETEESLENIEQGKPKEDAEHTSADSRESNVEKEEGNIKAGQPGERKENSGKKRDEGSEDAGKIEELGKNVANTQRLDTTNNAQDLATQEKSDIPEVELEEEKEYTEKGNNWSVEDEPREEESEMNEDGQKEDKNERERRENLKEKIKEGKENTNLMAKSNETGQKQKDIGGNKRQDVQQERVEVEGGNSEAKRRDETEGQSIEDGKNEWKDAEEIQNGKDAENTKGEVSRYCQRQEEGEMITQKLKSEEGSKYIQGREQRHEVKDSTDKHPQEDGKNKLEKKMEREEITDIEYTRTPELRGKLAKELIGKQNYSESESSESNAIEKERTEEQRNRETDNGTETEEEKKEEDVTIENTKMKDKLSETLKAKQKNYQEIELRDNLRHDIKSWIVTGVKKLIDQNALMEELLALKQKYLAIQKWWQNDVIYLRDVQRILTFAVCHMTKTTEEVNLARIVEDILQSNEPICVNQFPKIRVVRWKINKCLGKYKPDPFKIHDITLLPDAIKKSLEEAQLSEADSAVKLNSIQHRLESSMQDFFKRAKSYERLICLNILRLYGFKMDDLIFKNYLSEKEIRSLGANLGRCYKIFTEMTSETQRQAYVLKLSLFNVQEQRSAAQYTIDNLPTPLCEELLDVYKKCCSEHCAFEVTAFRSVLDSKLDKKKDCFDVSLSLYPLSMQLPFREIQKFGATQPDRNNPNVIKSIEKLLDALDMKQYYPQRLTYQQVITLTQDVFTEAIRKPTTLAELPWYFMRSIIRLDSDTRENCHVPTPNSDSSDDYSDDDDRENDLISTVHPLDLIHIIFLCADDFLRQELADKMSRCQYAVPLVLPPSDEGKAVLLHWGLRQLNRTYYCDTKVVSEFMVDAKTPVVMSLSFDRETSWKSKLINEILSPQQETFWHQGLKGGPCKQRTSQGMMEVAWYLPGKDENLFQYPVAFVNARGPVKHSDQVCKMLHGSVAAACLFAENFGDELKSYLNNSKSLENVIIIILHRKEQSRQLKKEALEIKQRYNLGDHQLIRKVADDKNFDVVNQKLKASIEQLIQRLNHKTSVAELKYLAHKCQHLDVDDFNCYTGQMAAESILLDIDQCNDKIPGSAKIEILPCQSDIQTRKEMAADEKELCRQKKRDDGSTIPGYATDLKKRIEKAKEKQLRNKISDTFKYFLRCLICLKPNDKKYFLHCLKFGLDERSIHLLHPLYEEFEKCRMQDDTPERKERLRYLDDQLTHRALGIEHFFREIAVMYENIAGTACGLDILGEVLEGLRSVMSGILLEGTSIEIMDGDVVNVPVAWLSAVLGKIDQRHVRRLYKVAVLGAQSCGKSTLLNTIFGLNFPVSSGRCTRGAYMQLVKVDDELKKTLKCDYVAVIDAEGLLSRSKQDDSFYDNELSTFIIGLSDLTLAIIKGEGKELNDILPLAIYVFLRMNIVGEHQACHFVHQNMGAVDAMTKVATEIEAFVQELDEKTQTAAKDVGQGDTFKRFRDIMKYDATTDHTYVPGLWDGTLPMAKTNTQYSRTMQNLKYDILKNVVDMCDLNKKQLTSCTDFARRLNELWEAIKYENFIMSFKNVLAVEVHRELSEIFRDLSWTSKRHIREMLQVEKHTIENETMCGRLKGSIQQAIDAGKGKLNDEIAEKVAEIEDKIMHYFKCQGCKDCNQKVQNRHLLANNEKEFEDEVRYLKRVLSREVDKEMFSLENKLKTDEGIQKLSKEMDTILTRKVQEVIRDTKSSEHTKDDIEDIFDQLWKEVTSDVMRRCKPDDDREDIEAIVQTTIKSLLGKDTEWKYIKKQRGRSQKEYSEYKFVVGKSKHLTLKNMWIQLTNLSLKVNEEDINRLQEQSDVIIAETQKYYNTKLAPEGQKFSQRDVDTLFKDVVERIEAIHDERFKITDQYKIDLLYSIEISAVKGFEEMHRKYLQQNSPKALLYKKEKSYHDIFIIKMGQGDVAVKFCENVLKDLIIKNIDEKLSCTELLHDLRVHCGETFRDIRGIQSANMIDLYTKDTFENYVNYIRFYQKNIKARMRAESIQHFASNKRLQSLGQIYLDQILQTLQQAIQECVMKSVSDGSVSGLSFDEKETESTSDENFIEKFFAKIDSLKIPSGVAVYSELDIPDRKSFGEIVQQQLDGKVKGEMLQILDAWNVEQKLEERSLIDFLFSEVVGCKERCPFCSAPCDVHSGGKTQGNHSTTLHRPQGLGGVRHNTTLKLVVVDCRMEVASDHRFKPGKVDHWVPHKEYQKVYPNWTIRGDANPDIEKYWKYVFAKFNSEFAEYYSAEKSDGIPDEWSAYTLEEIKKDIEDNYHIKIDVESLK